MLELLTFEEMICMEETCTQNILRRKYVLLALTQKSPLTMTISKSPRLNTQGNREYYVLFSKVIISEKNK